MIKKTDDLSEKTRFKNRAKMCRVEFFVTIYGQSAIEAVGVERVLEIWGSREFRKAWSKSWKSLGRKRFSVSITAPLCQRGIPSGVAVSIGTLIMTLIGSGANVGFEMESGWPSDWNHDFDGLLKQGRSDGEMMRQVTSA